MKKNSLSPFLPPYAKNTLSTATLVLTHPWCSNSLVGGALLSGLATSVAITTPTAKSCAAVPAASSLLMWARFRAWARARLRRATTRPKCHSAKCLGLPAACWRACVAARWRTTHLTLLVGVGPVGGLRRKKKKRAVSFFRYRSRGRRRSKGRKRSKVEKKKGKKKLTAKRPACR